MLLRDSPNKEPIQEGFPMRNWTVEVYLVNEADQALIPANVFEKVTYKLHESFGKRATQGRVRNIPRPYIDPRRLHKGAT